MDLLNQAASSVGDVISIPFQAFNRASVMMVDPDFYNKQAALKQALPQLLQGQKDESGITWNDPADKQQQYNNALVALAIKNPQYANAAIEQTNPMHELDALVKRAQAKNFDAESEAALRKQNLAEKESARKADMIKLILGNRLGGQQPTMGSPQGSTMGASAQDAANIAAQTQQPMASEQFGQSSAGISIPNPPPPIVPVQGEQAVHPQQISSGSPTQDEQTAAALALMNQIDTPTAAGMQAVMDAFNMSRKRQNEDTKAKLDAAKANLDINEATSKQAGDIESKKQVSVIGQEYIDLLKKMHDEGNTRDNTGAWGNLGITLSENAPLIASLGGASSLSDISRLESMKQKLKLAVADAAGVSASMLNSNQELASFLKSLDNPYATTEDRIKGMEETITKYGIKQGQEQRYKELTGRSLSKSNNGWSATEIKDK